MINDQSCAGEHPAAIQCNLVSCQVSELLKHDSYVRYGLSVSPGRLSKLIAIGVQLFCEPIKITKNLTIIDGYARFQIAQMQKRESMICLQYDLSEGDALRWLIRNQSPQDGETPYNRILLGLDILPLLEKSARANQQWGGHNKGSSKLAEAHFIDVRSQIAAIVGVSAGNVGKVRKILQRGHSDIQQAARTGEITIHKAWQWTALPVHLQLEELRQHRSRKGADLTSRRLIQKHVSQMTSAMMLPSALGSFLTEFDDDRRAKLQAITVAEIDAPGTVAYFTKDAFRLLTSKGARNGG